MSEHSDDSQMGRFERGGALTYSARDAVKAILIVAVLLVLLAGGSIRGAAAEIDPGIGREIVSAVGEPAEWIADRLPLERAQSELTSALSPDGDLDGGGFDTATAADGTSAEVSPVTAEAFDPAEIGAALPPKRELETLLVTGDSLATPLDTELARRLAPDGVEVIRDPQLGTGISNTAVGDWGELSTAQVAREAPDAVVMFIGANEGFSMPVPGGGEVACCDAEYAAVYANRVRQVIDNFRQGGNAKVYWLTVMTPRDGGARRVAQLVNATVTVAAQPWRSQVRVVDMVSIFTPGDRYTDSIEIDGAQTIVRESDGIHLNEAGSALAADEVLERIDQDFTR